MAQPYVGEIRMFAGNFAPAGWMFCEGQLLPISENETLFQLIGTTYGGDGESTFALPDLRGRIPIHQGDGFILAETGGAEEITLTVNQIPAHSHPGLATTNAGSATSPSTNLVPRHRAARDADSVRLGQPADQPLASGGQLGGWFAAAHQLSALSLRRLHHFPVRDLPESNLRRRHGSIRRRNQNLPVQLRP
jgi:microcystin-dependent protein